MVTCTLNNYGDPVVKANGTLITGATISFVLVDGDRKTPTSVFDVTSGELVSMDSVSTVLDSNGEFTINLWPNSRGEKATLYRVTIADVASSSFYINLVESPSPTTLIAAKTQAMEITESDLTLFQALYRDIQNQIAQVYEIATHTTNGLMSSTDKTYLDSVPDALDQKLSSESASATYAPIDSPAFTGTVSGITQEMVTGAGNLVTSGTVASNLVDRSVPIYTSGTTVKPRQLGFGILRCSRNDLGEETVYLVSGWRGAMVTNTGTPNATYAAGTHAPNGTNTYLSGNPIPWYSALYNIGRDEGNSYWASPVSPYLSVVVPAGRSKYARLSAQLMIAPYGTAGATVTCSVGFAGSTVANGIIAMGNFTVGTVGIISITSPPIKLTAATETTTYSFSVKSLSNCEVYANADARNWFCVEDLGD